MVQEEERLIGRGGRAHVTKDDRVDYRFVSITNNSLEGRGRHTLSVRQSLEQAGHLLKVGLGVDRVHDLRVVRPSLHIAHYQISILIGPHAAVELSREAVQAVARGVHVGPPHGDRQVGVGEGAVDHAALEARLAAAGGLAVATEAGGRVEEGRVGRVHGVGVDAPVPVGLCPLEAALGAQKILAQLYEPPVPRQEVGDEVDLLVEGEVGVDQLVVARCHGVDGGVLFFREVVEAHGGAEVLGFLVVGELAPLLPDLWVCAGASGPGDSARGSRSREGQECDDRRGKHRN